MSSPDKPSAVPDPSSGNPAASIPPVIQTIHAEGGSRISDVTQIGVVEYHLERESPVALTPEVKQQLEQTYRLQVLERSRHLHLELTDQQPIALTDVFVMLQAVESEVEDREKRSGEPPPKPLPVALPMALQKHQHLVLLGEPGAGKTTLLQYLAGCFAAEDSSVIEQRLNLSERRIPIWLPLRNFEPSQRFDDFVVLHLDMKYVPPVLARAWLDAGEVVLLLDGLDEVPTRQRRAVAEAIREFAYTPTGRKCRIVLTARTGYTETQMMGDLFGQFKIQSLTEPAEVERYVTGWLATAKNIDAAQAATAAHELVTRLNSHQRLQPLLVNPLLLRLIATTYAQSGEIILSRAALYAKYVEVLIERTTLRLSGNCPYTHAQILAGLQTIAWSLQAGEGDDFSHLEQALGNILDVDRHLFLEFVRDQMGLLVAYAVDPIRGPLLAFQHLTFQEFFVAQRLLKAWQQNPDQTWKFLQPRLHHPQWQEPILLFGGLLQRNEVAELVHRIGEAHSLFEHDLCRDKLLAANICQNSATIDPSVKSTILDTLKTLHSTTPSNREGTGYIGEDFAAWPMVGIGVVIALWLTVETLKVNRFEFQETLPDILSILATIGLAIVEAVVLAAVITGLLLGVWLFATSGLRAQQWVSLPARWRGRRQFALLDQRIDSVQKKQSQTQDRPDNKFTVSDETIRFLVASRALPESGPTNQSDRERVALAALAQLKPDRETLRYIYKHSYHSWEEDYGYDRRPSSRPIGEEAMRLLAYLGQKADLKTSLEIANHLWWFLTEGFSYAPNTAYNALDTVASHITILTVTGLPTKLPPELAA